MKQRMTVRASIIGGILLLAVPVTTALAADTFRAMRAAVNEKLKVKDYAGARSAATEARRLAAVPAERAEADLLLARAMSGAGDRAGAGAEYRRIMEDPAIPEKQKAEAQRQWLETFVKAWDIEGLKSEAGAALAEETESWPGRRAAVLKQLGESLRSWMWLDHAGARDCFVRLARLPGLTPDDKAQALVSVARTYSDEGRYAEARSTLQEAASLEGVPEARRLDILGAIAQAWMTEGDLKAARAAYTRLARLPVVKGSFEALAGPARTFESESNWAEARRAYEKVLERQDLDARMRFQVLDAIGQTYQKQGDLAGMTATVARAVVLDVPAYMKADAWIKLAGRATALNRRADARVMLETCSQLTGLDDSRRMDVQFRLAGACLWLGDTAAADGALEQAAALKGLKPEQQLAVRLRIAGVRGARGDVHGMRSALAQEREAAMARKLYPAPFLRACRDAAAFFLEHQQEAVVRQFLERADAIVSEERPHQPKVYECRFLDDVPLGAAGWAASDLIKNPKLRETRFEPYDQQSAADLILDASQDRPTQSGEEKAPERETAFAMAADEHGWHLYVQSGVRGLRSKLDAGESVDDMLEMFIVPGLERTDYYQWMVRLARNELTVVDWNTPHPAYRVLEGAITCETIALPDGWGTRVFIPWESLYDQLPLDGETWRFGLMRWMPGAVTWGGRVHETGRFGQVRWARPSPAQRLAIQRRLIKRAWARYQETERVTTDFWKDAARGDPEFYAAILDPVIKRWNERGDRVKTVDTLDAAAVAALWADVPGLMEFKFEVEALRRNYLATRWAKAGK